MIGLHYILISWLTPFVEYSVLFGLVAGISGFFGLSMRQKEKNISEFIFFCIFGACLLSPLGFFLLRIYSPYNSNLEFILFLILSVVGLIVGFFLERKWMDRVNRVLAETTQNSELERDKKTDIRKINTNSQILSETYNPVEYMKKDAWFIGLDSEGKPIYFEEKNLPHVEVCGTTGSGKGVVLGVLASQCIAKKEAVFILDPKNDEWLPHVAKAAADQAGEKYNFIDLTADEFQFNLFEDATSSEVEELLIAGFELGDKGQASDFYKIADRKMAKFISEQVKCGETAQSLYVQHSAFLEKEAPGFAGKFRELAEITAVNAKTGISLKEIIKNGGMVYIVGSMRNTKITRIQKMLLVRLIQIAEKRDRMTSEMRQVCVVLDELKYHLSRTALEALGASRDKGLHVVMAHQSVADLKDCPKDLEPDAVVGAILENTRIKIVYRVEMPETAEIFAKKSGTILVDDEVRFIERSLSLADHIKPHRHVKQSERFLVDENMFLSLPHRCCVVFGIGLPKKIYTSPYIAEKTKDSIEVIKLETRDEEVEKKNDFLEVDFEKLG